MVDEVEGKLIAERGFVALPIGKVSLQNLNMIRGSEEGLVALLS